MLITDLKEGCIVHLKPTATLADGRILSCETKQKAFKVCDIDYDTDVIYLCSKDDSDPEEIYVRFKDIVQDN